MSDIRNYLIEKIECFKERVFRIFRFPQYFLFLLEFLFGCLLLLLFLIKDINNRDFSSVYDYLLTCLPITTSVILFWIRKGKVYTSDYVVNQKFNIKLAKLIFKMVIFYVLTAPFIGLELSILDELGYRNLLTPIVLILSLLEFIIAVLEISPFFVVIIIALPFFLMSQIGVQNGLLKWTFLSFVLVTVGSNFLDKDLVKKTIGIEVEESRVSEVKFNYFFGILYLFLALFISEYLTSLYCYRYFVMTNELPSWFWDSLTKITVITCVSPFYIYFDERVRFFVLSNLFKKELRKIDGDYYLVEYDSLHDYWKLPTRKFSIIKDENGVYFEDIKHIKPVKYYTPHRLLDDVIEIDKQIYINANSNKLQSIVGKSKNLGYVILGKPLKSLGILPYLIIVLISIIVGINLATKNYFKIDGSYVGYTKRDDKIELNFSNKINIKNNKFIYRGKNESIDYYTFTFRDTEFSIKPLMSRIEIVNNLTDDKELYIRKGTKLYKEASEQQTN